MDGPTLQRQLHNTAPVSPSLQPGPAPARRAIGAGRGGRRLAPRRWWSIVSTIKSLSLSPTGRARRAALIA